ncbi:Acylamino-acid-releasing enzyme [Araneus ventricosus]|uniref:Acylamino-acid-releasing enzyme n=1 Tax=Araneus ventricosus TaxID=182803 RepID=A0A4Y2SWN7_ARAVE|nr:Acylamino-acid-releasing enzyme [Araneus ventricosus]
MISGAKILPAACDDVLCIHTMWSSQDFVEFQKNKFSRDFVIEKGTFKVLSSGIPRDMGSVLLHAFSKSGRKQAVLTEKNSQEKKTYLEIWNDSKKEATFDMTERKEHGNITQNDPFKCFEWSSDEKFILYAAEEKRLKSVSYFADTSQAKDEMDNIVKGEEYLYRQEWGEACVGCHHTVLCILEIETGVVQVLPTSKIGSDFSFGQAKWGPNDETVIFIGWKELSYKLGVWGCVNRSQGPKGERETRCQERKCILLKEDGIGDRREDAEKENAVLLKRMELEIEAKRIESTTEERVKSSIDVHHLIQKFDPKVGNISLDLTLFERQVRREKVPMELWVLRLIGLLPNGMA